MVGVLLINLGTPQAPTPKAVRRYLREFLSDPRVVEIPRALWWCILNGLILPFRSPRTAKAYQQIWHADGSPLLVYSKQLSQALQNRLAANAENPIHVKLAMRYGHPSIADGLNELLALNCKRIIVLPLYPQYAASTTASAFDAVSQALSTRRHVPEISFVNQYATEPGYIASLANSIHEHWNNLGKRNYLLISFHGLPKRQIAAGDPYYEQCLATARSLAKTLDLASDKWGLSFQSRLGKAKWLQPYTDKSLSALPQQGNVAVDVICPGFSVDCLETLEEIALRYKQRFIAAGGEQFHYIPCLNHRADHVDFLAMLINKYNPS